MKLRGRFTLWFCLAALIPIAAAALVTRSVVTKVLVEDAEEARTAALSKVETLLVDFQETLESKVGGLATADDPYVGGALLELEKGAGALAPLAHAQLRERGAPLMRQLSLDMLWLLGPEKNAIDTPHYMPGEGEDRKDLVSPQKNSYFAMEKILEAGKIRRVFALVAVRSVKNRGVEVHVGGGILVNEKTFASLEGIDGLAYRVLDLEGAAILRSQRAWDKKEESEEFPLMDREGTLLASVQIQIVNKALPTLLEKVTMYSAGLGLAALVATLLLGFWVARSMTRDLDSLVQGAHAAARGDLDFEVATKRKDEIGQVGQALNTMMLDLKESKERLVMAERVAAWQEIARRLAHEIKNPLTPIQMSMETLQKTYEKKHPSFDEVFRESTATVLEEASRLKRIVSEFSQFARMPKPKKSALSMSELLRSITSLYVGGGEVQLQCAEGLPELSGDKDTLRQLFLNLIENARDAVSEQPERRIEIELGLGREGRTISVDVSDNGPGVPPDMKDRLFTPYFTTKHAHGGTGLGLAIAHRIVSDHGGQISVHPSTLGGACFRVELPVSGEGDASTFRNSKSMQAQS